MKRAYIIKDCLNKLYTDKGEVDQYLKSIHVDNGAVWDRIGLAKEFESLTQAETALSKIAYSGEWYIIETIYFK